MKKLPTALVGAVILSLTACGADDLAPPPSSAGQTSETAGAGESGDPGGTTAGRNDQSDESHEPDTSAGDATSDAPPADGADQKGQKDRKGQKESETTLRKGMSRKQVDTAIGRKPQCVTGDDPEGGGEVDSCVYGEDEQDPDAFVVFSGGKLKYALTRGGQQVG